MKTTPIALAGALCSFHLASATSFSPLLGSHRSRTSSVYRTKAFEGSVFNAAVTGCDIAEKSCEGGCIPILGECCYTGSGGWCDLDTVCDNGGCCPIGKICDGVADGCSAGKETCGVDYCMPEGSVCCSDGTYCDAGETCGANKCLVEDDAIVECGDGSSCDAGEECTKTGCIPEGSVDCGDKTYCDAGEECTATGCIPEGAISCGNGKYCEAGYVCSTSGDGKCRKADDSDPSSTNSDATIKPTTTATPDEAEFSTTSSAEEASSTSSTRVINGVPNGLGPPETSTDATIPVPTGEASSDSTESDDNPDAGSSLRTAGTAMIAGLVGAMAFVL